MRACREGGEPYHIGDDQDRPDETAEPGLDHVSRAYAITAGSNDRFRRASRFRFGAVRHIRRDFTRKEFLPITGHRRRPRDDFGEGQGRASAARGSVITRPAVTGRRRPWSPYVGSTA
jgi:hypothetical protein